MIKSFSISLLLFLALDFAWLGYVMKDFNLRQLSAIGRIEDGKFQLLIGPTILTYLLMALSVTLFSIPRAFGKGGLEAFLLGAGLGFIIYGIYDMTNMAILKNYPLAFAIADISWGTFLFGFVTWLIAWKMRV